MSPLRPRSVGYPTSVLCTRTSPGFGIVVSSILWATTAPTMCAACRASSLVIPPSSSRLTRSVTVIGTSNVLTATSPGRRPPSAWAGSGRPTSRRTDGDACPSRCGRPRSRTCRRSRTRWSRTPSCDGHAPFSSSCAFPSSLSCLPEGSTPSGDRSGGCRRASSTARDPNRTPNARNITAAATITSTSGLLRPSLHSLQQPGLGHGRSLPPTSLDLVPLDLLDVLVEDVRQELREIIRDLRVEPAVVIPPHPPVAVRAHPVPEDGDVLPRLFLPEPTSRRGDPRDGRTRDRRHLLLLELSQALGKPFRPLDPLVLGDLVPDRGLLHRRISALWATCRAASRPPS